MATTAHQSYQTTAPCVAGSLLAHRGVASMTPPLPPAGYTTVAQQQQQPLTTTDGQQSTLHPRGTMSEGDKVLSERVVEHEVRVPKRIVREEVIEKVLVVPETIMREEIVEEVQKVKETIIEVAKPTYQEKIVEVPEVEYREKIVEVVEKVLEEKIREVPKIQYQERIIEVPKYITQEKIVEVSDIEYREVIVEKIVEVPEIREQVVVREVRVPQYVEKVVPTYENVEVAVGVNRNIPVPVEAVTTYEYQLSQYQPRVSKIQYPLYVPRFVEVPVSAELFDATQLAQMQNNQARLAALTTPQALGLNEIEAMATEMRQQGFLNQQVPPDAFQVALTNAWKSGQLQMVTTQNSLPTVEKQ